MTSGHRTRQVRVGRVAIGGGAPVSVQSMLTEPVTRTEEALEQARRLRIAGCEIVRVAVPGRDTVPALSEFVRRSPLPVVADIHYDASVALAAVSEARVHKVRINPGNIRNPELLPELAAAASEAGTPIRVGLNSGSVAPRKRGRPVGEASAEMLVEAAVSSVRRLEELGFRDIVVSAKSPDVRSTIETYSELADRLPYPLHLGVTAAGGVRTSTIKHSAAFSALLLRGIGDTVRVSISGDPVEEVRVGWGILRSLGLRRRGAEVIACPTCGRTTVNLPELVAEVEEALDGLLASVGEENWPETIRSVAVMGCAVNGPGEASAADFGVAFGGKGAVVFRRGEIVARTSASRAVPLLLERLAEAVRGET